MNQLINTSADSYERFKKKKKKETEEKLRATGERAASHLPVSFVGILAKGIFVGIVGRGLRGHGARCSSVFEIQRPLKSFRKRIKFPKNRFAFNVSYCLFRPKKSLILLAIMQSNLLANRERPPRWGYSILGFLDRGRCRLQWRGPAGSWSAAPSVTEAFRAPDNRPASWAS